MPFENSPEEEIIPTMDFTTILTDDEPTIHVKHYFDIIELEKVGLKLDETLLFCGGKQGQWNSKTESIWRMWTQISKTCKTLM